MLQSTDSTCTIVLIMLLLHTNINLINSSRCSRTPDGAGALQTPADGRFHIRIMENEDKYTPGKTYNIRLEGIVDATQRTSPPTRFRFSRFMLVVERKSHRFTDVPTSTFGTFELLDQDSLTKISPTCENMVTETTATPKSEIQVEWTAPKIGSGCVAFKATVIEHRDVWFIDDGPLTKEFCEVENFEDEFNVPIDCCACTEAKYEFAFEGLWTRNTHPKHFPTNIWTTKFSDIIGASHIPSYRFWRYGESASEGVKDVAESGSTELLESDLKAKSFEIRTIIKAKGLTYPNITDKTFAVFRVDPTHNLISFVSKIDPSPDWFLGISGLDLCKYDNCSWVESRVLDLYPWDAGTDSGHTYDDVNNPTNPREFIRRIRSDYPFDPRSPFYDPMNQMMPFARLHIYLQRIYNKTCTETTDEDEACALDHWRDYSPCDEECGEGNKEQRRQYLNEQLAREAGCRHELRKSVPCYLRECVDDRSVQNPTQHSSCNLTPFSQWSECSVKCGHGNQTRTRSYVQRNQWTYCQARADAQELVEFKPCYSSCSGDINTMRPDMDCRLGPWSEYENCTTACGGGIQIRTRQVLSGNCQESDLQEETPCNMKDCEVPSYCREDPDKGPCRVANNMWFYNWSEKRCDMFGYGCGVHQNKFDTYEQCWRTCSEQNPMYRHRLETNLYHRPRGRVG